MIINFIKDLGKEFARPLFVKKRGAVVVPPEAVVVPPEEVGSISARYWRLLGLETSSNGLWRFSLYTAKMFESADCSGTDVARTATAFAGGYTSSYTADKANDGSDSTYWRFDASSATWWGIDAGAGNSLEINSISFKFRTSTNYGPQSLALQYSNNGETWETVSSFNTVNDDNFQNHNSLQ